MGTDCPGSGDGTGCDGTGCDGTGCEGVGCGVGPGAGDGAGCGEGPGAGEGGICEGTGFDGVICPEIFQPTVMPTTVRASSVRIFLLFINHSSRRPGKTTRLSGFDGLPDGREMATRKINCQRMSVKPGSLPRSCGSSLSCPHIQCPFQNHSRMPFCLKLRDPCAPCRFLSPYPGIYRFVMLSYYLLFWWMIVVY